jgi:hypothetical protein
MRSALEILLGDCTKEEFLRDSFEQAPRHLREALQGSDADPLFDLADADCLLSNFDLRYPQLELIVDGDARRPPAFSTGIVNRNRLLERVRRGASIRIRNVQMLSSRLVGFARRLSQELSGLVNINAYITPSGKTAFKPHYDDHDVFVAQCFGDKRWVVNKEYDNRIEFPSARLHSNEVHVRRSDAASEQHYSLHERDVLYLPRGTLHYATASERGSIHLTLSYMPVTWGHLFEAAIRRLERTDSDLRKAAHPHLLQAAVGRDERFVETFHRYLSRIDIPQALAAARDELAGACPPPSERILFDIFSPLRIDADTMLALNEGSYYAADRNESGRADSLLTHGSRLVLQGRERDYFFRIESARRFTPADLANEHDVEDCAQFLTSLFREGVVRFVHIDSQQGPLCAVQDIGSLDVSESVQPRASKFERV